MRPGSGVETNAWILLRTFSNGSTFRDTPKCKLSDFDEPLRGHRETKSRAGFYIETLTSVIVSASSTKSLEDRFSTIDPNKTHSLDTMRLLPSSSPQNCSAAGCKHRIRIETSAKPTAQRCESSLLGTNSEKISHGPVSHSASSSS